MPVDVILLRVFLEASKSCNAMICAPALFPRMSEVLFLKIVMSWSKAIQTLVLKHLGNNFPLSLFLSVSTQTPPTDLWWDRHGSERLLGHLQN